MPPRSSALHRSSQRPRGRVSVTRAAAALLAFTALSLVAVVVIYPDLHGTPHTPAAAVPSFRHDAARQWYLNADRAWSAWRTPPALAPTKVAVIDSGIDAGAPAFAGRIAAGKSFVGGSWRVDSEGHGTFVAGIIAADAFAGSGIAGIAFNAKLLIAKVVDRSGVIPPAAEARAIRWATDQGAKVINLSFGGQRDPNNPEFDFYSRSERDAVEYAYAKGVVVVAAVGNGTNAPSQPWRFADWPAALPNVLGVAAVDRNGSVPSFSNRDPLYVDIAAPGVGIFSTIPRLLERRDLAGCVDVPYSNCGPDEFRNGNGTSFAAPQVSAAAALLLGVDPGLAPDQVDWLLERTATDATAANGCLACRPGRDALTGWGRLDVARAVDYLRAHAPLPPRDVLEPDGGFGSQAYRLRTLPRTFSSSEDYWDDPIDVFALKLRPGQRLEASLRFPAQARMSLRLWKPDAGYIGTPRPGSLAASAHPAAGVEHLSYRPTAVGLYYLEVVDRAPSRQRARYRLSLSASPQRAQAGLGATRAHALSRTRPAPGGAA